MLGSGGVVFKKKKFTYTVSLDVPTFSVSDSRGLDLRSGHNHSSYAYVHVYQ